MRTRKALALTLTIMVAPVAALAATSASIGQRAIANVGPLIACPEWNDYKKVISDLVANDKVGMTQDFSRGECTVIQKGDTGLVIDAGFTSIRVRLDKDRQAYWTELMAGQPMEPTFVAAANPHS